MDQLGGRARASTRSRCAARTSSRTTTSRTRRRSGIVYDSGDYEGTLDKMLEHLDLDGFRAEQAELRERGHPSRHRLLHLHRGLRPGALAGRRPAAASACRRPSGSRRLVRVHPTGSATVYTGTSPHGQGLDTELRADRRRPARRRSRAGRGDPRRHQPGPVRAGAPTARARSSVGGEAIARAAERVQEKAKRDLRRDARGRAGGHRARRRRVPRQGLARQGRCRWPRSPAPAYIPPQELPDRDRAGARGDRRSTTPRTSSSRSARTPASSTSTSRPGKVEVVRWVAVDDCGPAINPMLIDGQVHGGIAHGDRPGALRADRLRRRGPAA